MKKLNMLAAVMTMTATITLLGTPIQARAAEDDFDPIFYAETYPDVVAVVGTDAEALYNHYINNGKAEGRLPHATTTDAPTTQTKAGSKWEEIEPYLENAPTVDMNDPGSERLREMLKDVPMDDELREVVIRIGDGAKWDFDSKYEYRDNSGTHNSGDACQGYTDMMESIVYGHNTFAYGDRYLTSNSKNPIKIQQYDTIVVPGANGNTHVVFVLYIDPVTGNMLTTEGNWNGITRTGWNLRKPGEMSAVIRRRTEPYDPAKETPVEGQLTLDDYNNPEYRAEMKAYSAELQAAALIKDPQERQNAIRAVKAKYGY